MSAAAPNILVLGTSNSIMKDGWLAGFRATLPAARIDNRSVGGSTSLQFAGELDTDMRPFDWVIFDGVVNDENKIGHFTDRSLFWSILLEILQTISAQSRLIVLGFTAKRHVARESNEAAMHRQLAQAVSAEYAPLQPVLAELALRRGVDGVYPSISHPVSEFAYAFGVALAETMVQQPVHVRSHGGATSAYETIRADDPALSAFPSRDVANSHVSTKVAHVPIGGAVLLPEAMMCVGVRVHSSTSHAMLHLRTADGVVVQACDAKPKGSGMLRFQEFATFPVADQMSVHEVDATSGGIELDRLVLRTRLARRALPVLETAATPPADGAFASEVTRRWRALLGLA
ncbi:MAG: hypothetical protein ABUS57_04210 [Pseudomonadota bacterium]